MLEHEMTVLGNKAKDVIHAVEHPVETAKHLEHEAEEGSSARTPAIAIVGVSIVLFAILVIMLAIAMTAYFLEGGR
jgi:hypothetical protein